MEIITKKIQSLKWDLPASGIMEATLEDGKLTHLKFCKNGKDEASCFSYTDEEWLRDIHKGLSDIFELKDQTLGNITEEQFTENQTKS